MRREKPASGSGEGFGFAGGTGWVPSASGEGLATGMVSARKDTATAAVSETFALQQAHRLRPR